MIDIFDKLNAAYGSHVLADSDQIKDKLLNKTQEEVNDEVLGSDPTSIKSKVDSFTGIVIGQGEDVVSSDPADIAPESAKVPTGNAVAGAINVAKDSILSRTEGNESAELTDYNTSQKRATIYGDFRVGDKIKVWATGTGVTDFIILRYNANDSSTYILSLTNNGPYKEFICDRNTDHIDILCNNNTFTTEGTATVHLEYGFGLETDEKIQKEISILFIGNSLQQDAVAYLPLLLKELTPKIKFNIYLWYIGAATVATHLEYFNNNTPCATFSVWTDNDAKWTNYSSSKTMSDILSSYHIDIVCLQEYFNNSVTYDATNVTTYRNALDYISSHYNGKLKFVTFFHAPRRESPNDLGKANTVYITEENGINLLLKNTVLEDVIPAGKAIVKGMTYPILDSLGDAGHLSYDGTHAQEGLPCMMQSYVIATWIFKQLGIIRSIADSTVKISSAEQLTEYNIPGTNGTPVASTAEQDKLSKDCALSVFNKIEENKPSLGQIKQEVQYINLTTDDFMYDYMCKQSGEEVFGDNLRTSKATPILPVKEGDVITYKGISCSSNSFMVIAYDKGLNVLTLSSILGTGSVISTDTDYTVQSGVYFIRLCGSSFTGYCSVVDTNYTNFIQEKEYINAAIDKSKYIEAGTVLVDKTDSSWTNGQFNSGSNSFRLYIKDSLTSKVTLDKKKCYGGKKFKSDTNAKLVFYNKEGGYCGYIDITDRNEHTFPKYADTFRMHVAASNLDNAKIYISEGFMYDKPEDIVDVLEQSKLGDGIHIFRPNITNGKFRLYTEFTLDEDVNIGAEATDKILLTLKNGDDKVKVFVRKQAVTQLEVGIAGSDNYDYSRPEYRKYLNYLCKYPLPDFHSGFGFETTGIVGKTVFASRTLPNWIPLCGEAFLTVRYKGIINSTENAETHVTTNTTSVKVSVTNNSVSFSGTVGAGDVSLSKSIAITSGMTADDLAAAINADNTLNEYIEAKAVSYNGDKLVYSQLINCSDIEIVTTSPNAVNAPETDGTSPIACPMYLFSKIDKTKHTIEIMSDGINARIVVDGQNTGKVWNNWILGSTGNPTAWLNYDLIPMLNENLEVIIGGDENGVDAKITTEFVRIDINSNSDAEAVANERIISKYNPNHIIMMGHGTWDGPELDGGKNGTGVVSLSDLPEGCVKDSTLTGSEEANMASSTGRLKRIAKMAYEFGYEWVNPAELINVENKKKAICAIFDDFRIDNYYKTAIRQGFAYGMKANYAIENMKRFIPDAEAQRKIDYLQMIGWKCFIHGNGGDANTVWNDKICSLTYEQLYTDDDTIVPSIAHNLKDAVKYNIDQTVWIYSGGAQTPNGLMAMQSKGIKVGPEINTKNEYYICKAAQPLYWKRYNIADKVRYTDGIGVQGFLMEKQMLPTTLNISASSDANYTHKVNFNLAIRDTAMIERAGVVYSSLINNPTIDGDLEKVHISYDPDYLPMKSIGYSPLVNFDNGTNYVRLFVVYADGTVVYGDVTEYTV